MALLRSRCPTPLPPGVKEIRTNEALLFRYSALIFNAHRIHYDREYARESTDTAGSLCTGR